MIRPALLPALSSVPDMSEGEAAGWNAIPETVLCPEYKDVPAGSTCPHLCSPGQCKGCPANDE